MTKTPQIYIVGDSISIQYGPFLKTRLQGHFHYDRKSGEEEALKNLDIPKGANGGDSQRVLNFLKALYEHDNFQTDLLLLNCGLHDIKREKDSGKPQIELSLYRENLEAIVALTAAKQQPVVWINTTPVDEEAHNKTKRDFERYANDVIAYNETADAVIKAHSIPLIDLNHFTLQLEEPLFKDGVHFIESVQQAQANFIAGWLDCWKNQHFAHTSET